MRKNFSTTLAFLTVLTLILAPYGSIKAKAAVSSLEIPNNYEIAVAGTNLDAVVDSAGNAHVVFERSGKHLAIMISLGLLFS